MVFEDSKDVDRSVPGALTVARGLVDSTDATERRVSRVTPVLMEPTAYPETRDNLGPATQPGPGLRASGAEMATTGARALEGSKAASVPQAREALAVDRA